MTEVIDFKLQVGIDPRDSYEDLRSVMHQRLDLRFNQLFAAELKLMPARVSEGENWKQLGMFNDHL